MAKKAKSAARPSGKTSGPQKASGKATGKAEAKDKKAAAKQPSAAAVSGAKTKPAQARSPEAASQSSKAAKKTNSPAKSEVKTEPKSAAKPESKSDAKVAPLTGKKSASTSKGVERKVLEKISDKKSEKKPPVPVASAKKKGPDKPTKKAEAADSGEELVDEAFGVSNEDEFLAEDLEALGDPDLDANADAAEDDLAGDDEDGEGEQRRPSALRKAIGRGRAPAAKVDAEESADGDEAEDSASSATAEKKVKRKDDLKIDRTGDLEQQWKTLFEKSKGIKPAAYKMSESYEARTPLVHKVLGWGYILTSQNDRLEVLFAEGIKFLISNRKS